MKAIYRGKSYYVEDTVGDQIILLTGRHKFHVPLRDRSLIVDPTDDELRHVESAPPPNPTPDLPPPTTEASHFL